MKNFILILVIQLATLGTANATIISYSGNFADDDTRFYTSFDVTVASTVTLTSFGYAGGINGSGDTISDGGFDSQLFIFDSFGTLLFSDDDNSNVTSSSSGNSWDALISEVLGIGSYVAVLTQYNNDYVSGDLFSGVWSGSGVNNFLDVSSSQRNSSYAFDIDGEFITNVTTTISNPVDVPEPSSIAMFGVGMLGLVTWRRRQFKA